MKYSNTRYFKFVPFSSTGAVSDKIIRSGIYLQNKFLKESTAITIVRLKSVDSIVPNTSKAFKELVLSVETEGSKLFSTVELDTSENKAHLVTRKTHLEVAKHRWMAPPVK